MSVALLSCRALPPRRAPAPVDIRRVPSPTLSNSSGRIEVVPQLGHLLSLGVAVVAFDFTGSGKSEGEFVSLGYYEREDLQTVIHHLRASGDVSSIALWGRSMGAATAIMYGSRDPTISCMILDSAFTDLTRLAEEMVERGKEQVSRCCGGMHIGGRAASGTSLGPHARRSRSSWSRVSTSPTL